MLASIFFRKILEHEPVTILEMKNAFTILLLTLLLFSCKNQSEPKPEIVHIEKTELIVPKQTVSIAEQWNLMVLEKGGCLGGGQYFKETKREIPTMVFSETEWKKFSENDKRKLTEFLITKLSDTTKSKVHTCPFFEATNGEMAVYSLQHIHEKNWYDFSEFQAYKDQEITSAMDQPQIWLQNVLKNENERKKLAELFKNKMKN